MSFTRTLAQLKTEVQGLGEFENSTDLTGSVLLAFINDALTETREYLVDSWEDYYTTSGTIATVAGTESYNLPTDFQKLRRAEVLVGSEYIRIRSFDLTARSYYGTDQVEPRRCRYRMQAGSIYLAPPPNTATTLRLWYVPIVTELVNDADTATFRVPLEHKLLLQVAKRDCLDRQELDPSPADRAIARLVSMVIRSAANRDITEPFSLDPRGAPRDIWDSDEDDLEGWNG